MIERAGVAACRAISLMALALVTATQAHAAQRTFVATSGIDTNPCTLTMPCRGFTAAVAAVGDGGEIIVLDSGGYGTVTIAKPVSITAPKGVYAGVSVLSGTGIVINAPGKVTLRGLTINGQGGTNGIDFQSSDVLELFDVDINGVFGEGILASGGGMIAAEDITVRNNGSDALRLSNATRMHVRGSRFENNLRALRADDAIWFTATDTTFVGNQYEAIYVQANTGQTTVVNLDRCLVAENGHFGFAALQTRAVGATARVDLTLSRSTLTLNGGAAVTIGYAFAGDGLQAAYIVDNTIINNGGPGIAISVPQFDNTQGKIVLSGNTIARNAYGVTCDASGLVTRGTNTIRDNVSGQINCAATVTEPGS